MLTGESTDNLEADVLTGLYNPHAPGFFSAYLHGRKHSDLRFHVRPRGAFPGMMDTPEEVAVINLDPQGNQEGIWYLSHLGGEITSHTASSDQNNRTVEADAYKIATTIARNFLMPVPLYADFDGRIVRLGAVNMLGSSTSKEIDVTLPKRPKRVMVNYWHDVLEAL